MWQVAAVRSGVRAMPPRTQNGKVPLAGRVPGRWLRARAQPATSLPASAAAGDGGSTQHSPGAEAAADVSHGGWQAAGLVAEGVEPVSVPSGPGPSWWLLAGLGARGLTYHAWLGRHMAAAVLADDESLLPRELRAWQKRLDL